MNNEHPGSYFWRIWYQFFGLKYLNSLMQIRIRDLVSPGSGIQMEKVGSGINISDPKPLVKTPIANKQKILE
jgi:hypothetical protein